MKFSLLSFLLFLGVFLNAQVPSVTSNEFQQLVGEWDGSLTYVDYRDDKSNIKLKCNMIASWKGNKGTIKIGFTEPNGKIIYDKVKLNLLKQGKVVKFDGEKYQVNSLKKVKGFQLVMSCISKDNNRVADIKQFLNINESSITITKKVKYKGTEDFFLRNEYVLNRVN